MKSGATHTGTSDEDTEVTRPYLILERFTRNLVDDKEASIRTSKKSRKHTARARRNPHCKQLTHRMKPTRGVRNVVKRKAPPQRNESAVSSRCVPTISSRMIQIVLYSTSQTYRKRDAQKNSASPGQAGTCSKDLFGELATEDQRVLNIECGSTLGHKNAVVVQDHCSAWLQKLSEETKKLMKHWPVSEDSCHRFKNLRESTRALRRSFDKSEISTKLDDTTNTPHRSETHAVIERSVRRVKKVRQSRRYKAAFLMNGGTVRQSAGASFAT